MSRRIARGVRLAHAIRCIGRWSELVLVVCAGFVCGALAVLACARFSRLVLTDRALGMRGARAVRGLRGVLRHVLVHFARRVRGAPAVRRGARRGELILLLAALRRCATAMLPRTWLPVRRIGALHTRHSARRRCMVPCRARLADICASRGELALRASGTSAIGAPALARRAYLPWRARGTARTACHGSANGAEFAVCAVRARGSTCCALEAAGTASGAAASAAARLVAPSGTRCTNPLHCTTAACMLIASGTMLIARTARPRAHSGLELTTGTPLALRLPGATVVGAGGAIRAAVRPLHHLEATWRACLAPAGATSVAACVFLSVWASK